MTQQFERTPGVQAVTVASGTPGIGGIANPRIELAPFTPPEQLEQAGTRMQHQTVGFDYFEMLGIETIAGRTFSEERSSDLGQAIDTPGEFGETSYDGRAFVINRAMAEAQGWTPDEAIGKEIRAFTYENGNTYMDHRGTIIGVVEDYHARPLYEEIEPMLFEVGLFPSDDGSTTYVNASRYLVKLAPGSAAATMDRLQQAWNEARPTRRSRPRSSTPRSTPSTARSGGWASSLACSAGWPSSSRAWGSSGWRPTRRSSARRRSASGRRWARRSAGWSSTCRRNLSRWWAWRLS